MRDITEDKEKGFNVDITSTKLPDHIDDELSAGLKDRFGFTLVLPGIVCFLRMIVGILEEKESKVREGMKIMGLGNLPLYLSWIVWQSGINLIVAILVCLLLKVSIFVNSDYLLILLFYWLY